MAVIEPYMTPRTYPVTGLDTFTTYWAAFTTARSARHQQMMELMLQQMDNDNIDDLISDLRRRRSNLEDARYRLDRNEISDISRRERAGSGASSSEFMSFARLESSFDNERDDRRREYQGVLRERAGELDEERQEELEQDQDWEAANVNFRGDARNLRNRANVSGGRDATRIYGEAIRSAQGGDEFEQHVRGVTLYRQALEDGHEEAAGRIQRELLGGRTADSIEDRYLARSPEEFQDYYDSQMESTEASYVPPDREGIYSRAEEAQSRYGSQPRTDESTDSLRSATDIYGERREELTEEIQALDLQMLALSEQVQLQRAATLNAVQQMLSQNINFAPFAFRVDETGQEFFDRVVDENPERVSRYLEEIEMRGSPGAVGRAERSGRMDPVDFPAGPTTAEEFAGGGHGQFVFGRLYEQINEIEQTLSNPMTWAADPANNQAFNEAYEAIVDLIDVSEHMLSMTAQDTGSHDVNQEVADRLSLFIEMLLDTGVTLPDDFRGYDWMGTWGLTTPSSVGGMGQYQQGEANWEQIVEEVRNASNVALKGIGASDVRIGDMAADSLDEQFNRFSGIDQILNEDERNERQLEANQGVFRGLYSVAQRLQLISEIDPELAEDTSRTLNRMFELSGAEGDFGSLMREVNSFIQSADLTEDQAFREYLADQGDVIPPPPAAVVEPDEEEKQELQLQSDDDAYDYIEQQASEETVLPVNTVRGLRQLGFDLGSVEIPNVDISGIAPNMVVWDEENQQYSFDRHELITDERGDVAEFPFRLPDLINASLVADSSNVPLEINASTNNIARFLYEASDRLQGELEELGVPDSLEERVQMELMDPSSVQNIERAEQIESVLQDLNDDYARLVRRHSDGLAAAWMYSGVFADRDSIDRFLWDNELGTLIQPDDPSFVRDPEAPMLQAPSWRRPLFEPLEERDSPYVERLTPPGIDDDARLEDYR